MSATPDSRAAGHDSRTSPQGALHATGAPRQVAVYVDGDNLPALVRGSALRRLLDVARPLGALHIVRVYADFSVAPETTDPDWAGGWQAVHLPTQGRGKNAVDVALAVDVIDDLHLAPGLGVVILATGDGDLAPLARRLRQRGRRVIGVAGRHSTAASIRTACNEFWELEALGLGAGVGPIGRQGDRASADASLLASPEAAQPGGRQAATQAWRAVEAALYEPSPDVRSTPNGAQHDERASSFEALQQLPVPLLQAVAAAIDDVNPTPSVPVRPSALKQALLQRFPSFAEGEYGTSTFTRFLTAYAPQLGLRLARTRGNDLEITRLRSASNEALHTQPARRMRSDGEESVGNRA